MDTIHSGSIISIPFSGSSGSGVFTNEYNRMNVHLDGNNAYIHVNEDIDYNSFIRHNLYVLNRHRLNKYAIKIM